MKKIKFRCPICKGTNVQVKAWVDANTNEVIGECEEEAWCDDCEEEVRLEDYEE